jgi:hypothetical protein
MQEPRPQEQPSSSTQTPPYKMGSTASAARLLTAAQNGVQPDNAIIPDVAYLNLHQGRAADALKSTPNAQRLSDGAAANIPIIEASKSPDAAKIKSEFTATQQRAIKYGAKISNLKSDLINIHEKMLQELKAVCELVQKAKKPIETAGSASVGNVIKSVVNELKRLEKEIEIAKPQGIKLTEELHSQIGQMVKVMPPKEAAAMKAATANLDLTNEVVLR